MPSPLMSGNQNLQGYVSRRYHELHSQGYSKSEAHAIAFQELRELIAEQEALEAQQQQIPPDPFNSIIYSDQPGF